MSLEKLTRRQFSAGLLAAGAMAVAPRFARAQSGPKNKLRAAVFGCRNRGWQVAFALQTSGFFDVPQVYDCDSAMFDIASKELKDRNLPLPKFAKDFRTALDDKGIDVVAVCAPDHWHALMAVMALEAGKHVYLEKPAAYNIADGQAIVAAQKKHPKLVVQVGTQQRSGRHFMDARDFIRAGELGKVAFARAWLINNRQIIKKVPDSAPPSSLDYEMWVGPAPMRPYNVEKLHYNWHFMRDYGSGDAGNWGGHWLDTVRMLADLDLPTSAMGYGGRYVTADEKEWPDTQTVLYEFPKCTVEWELRYWSRYGPSGKNGGVEIHGEKGTVVIDRDGWTFHPNGDPKKVQRVDHKTSQMEEPHIANFAKCITDGAKPNASIVEGHKSAILCHLANIAGTVNRKVEFDPKTETIVNDAEAAKMTRRAYRSPWQMPT
jgi:predicted dehydrogenase